MNILNLHEDLPFSDDNMVPDCVDVDDDGDGEPDDTDCAPLDNTLQIASPETCDGEDNDCNGVPDDNLPPITCGEGVCEHSVASCLNGVPQSCNPFEGASEEICDGLDNNCNGSVTDEEGLQTGLCEQCSNGSGTNVPNGNDPFNQCTGQSCASANYHHGWVSNTCLYNGAQYGNHCNGAGSCETAASGCGSGSIPGPSTGVTRGTCQSMSGCSGTAGPSTNAVAAGSDPHGDCASWKTCNGGTSCCASMNNWIGNWNVSVNETCKGEGTYPNLNFSMTCGASSGGNYGGSVTCNYFITGEVNGTCIITITRTGCNSFNLKYSACSLPGPSYSANAPINMNNQNSGSGSFSSTLGDCGALSVHR